MQNTTVLDGRNRRRLLKKFVQRGRREFGD
jgi:hypothetical protein